MFDELGVSATKLVVGDVGVDVVVTQVLHVAFVGEAGVGGDDDFVFIIGCRSNRAFGSVF